MDERNVPLRDGTTVRIREIRPDDRDRMLAMWERTSDASRRLRFHGTFKLGEHNVDRFTDLDPATQLALVATLGRGEDEHIVGVARYERGGPGSPDAEFAVLVQDDQQGRGIGTVLVRTLATVARDDGITQLTGDILSENAAMHRLVRDLGLASDSSGGMTGSVRTDLELEFGDTFLQVVDEDDARAARAAIERFLAPTSVAVVGASRDRGAVGALVFESLLRGGFEGPVYPVNRDAAHVAGVTAYADLSSCPQVPDLVVVCVPAEAVADVVDEAGELGVRAAVVITAGFAEAGAAGARLQADLLDTANGHGMRLVGPNCMGVLNGDPGVRLNATFSDSFPGPGRISMSSQSGALGLAVLDHVASLGLGMSSFVSIGNKADISSNDLLLYWEADPSTDLVLLYLESFGNPRKFSRIARRMSRRKPIVAVTSGVTRAGRRAASHHTAALAGTDAATQALFAQTGVVRVDTFQEMLDVATVLATQPLPSGARVAVLTDAGGPASLAADACASNGLVVGPLAQATRDRLAEVLPEHVQPTNPLDLTTAASPEAFGRALRVLGTDPEVDIVLVLFIPTGHRSSEDVAAALAAARAEVREDVTVVSVFLSKRGVPAELQDAGIPSFAFPEDAARTLGRLTRYADWRRRPLGRVVRPGGIRPEVARTVVERALAAAGGDARVGAHAEDLLEGRRGPAGRPRPAVDVWLSQVEAEAVLDAYGVTLARARLVTDVDEVPRVVEQLGLPVVVKVASPVHKSDIGGVELDLRSTEEVEAAVARLRQRMLDAGHPEHADRFLVQELVRDGVEMTVGVVPDPSFGPLVLAGMGGTLVELVEDVQVRVTPLTDLDVDDMLEGLRMRPLLDGYRGSPATDVAALRDLLHRLDALVEDLPEVVEVDCNPVFVRPGDGGVVAVDVRVRVAA